MFFMNTFQPKIMFSRPFNIDKYFIQNMEH